MPPDVGVAVFVSLRSLKDKTRPSPTPTGIVVDDLGMFLLFHCYACPEFYKKRPENSEQLTSVQLIASAIRCSHRETDFIGESHFGLHLIFTGSLMLLDQFTFGNKESWLKFCFPFRNFHKRSFKILKDLKRTNVCFIVHIIHTLR